MEYAIQVRDIAKVYRISEHSTCYRTFRDVIVDSATAPFRRAWSVLKGQSAAQEHRTRDFWALKGVSFDVRAGEVLGVIGRNGSGKSTLLKILSQITNPSSGSARIVGRVGSLLEVGTGFHFELSGRDNIYLNGAMLGMRRTEIARKFDEIVEFSQIGEFLDTPVKHYSSGMYMRLAFSVASHLESEILLVDEVLAVGDYDFQKKCIAKMRELTQTGRTVLFVSHSMGSVEELCDRAMILDHGRLDAIGPVSEIIERYLPPAKSETQALETWKNPLDAPGNEFVTLQSVAVVASDGAPRDAFELHEPIFIRIAFWNQKAGESYHVRIGLRDEQGAWVLSGGNEYSASNEGDPWTYRPCPIGLFESTCCIPGDLLNDQTYGVTVEIIPVGKGPGLQYGGSLQFRINDPSRLQVADELRFSGPLRPRLSWRTDFRSAA